MRYPVLVLFACLVAACTSGPGSGCDECAEAEATIANPTPGSSNAAAAAAGGQRSDNAPYARDLARLSPNVVNSRGAGAATLEDSSHEQRHVASGGSQNLGVVLPTEALSHAGGGGTNLNVLEAAKTVAAYRAMLQLALTDLSTPPDRIDTISAGLARAQEALSAAQSASNVSHVTHNRFDNAVVNQFGVSSSSTDGRADAETIGKVSEAAARTATGLQPFEKPSAEKAEFPPPAGAGSSPIPPSDGGG
jgi:hypothetical protein